MQVSSLRSREPCDKRPVMHFLKQTELSSWMAAVDTSAWVKMLEQCMRGAFRGAYVQGWRSGRTGLHLCFLGLANDELVELLLVFGAEVLQALLGFGGDLELVHCGCICFCVCRYSEVVVAMAMMLVLVGTGLAAVW